MPVLISLIVGLAIIAGLAIYGLQCLYKDAEKTAKGIVSSANAKVNQFASLPPEELSKELSATLALIISRDILTYISAKDADAVQELYLRAQIDFLEYYSGSIDYIDQRYGKDYLLKWYNLRFTTMQAEGSIDSSIDKKLNVISLDEPDEKKNRP